MQPTKKKRVRRLAKPFPLCYNTVQSSSASIASGVGVIIGLLLIGGGLIYIYTDSTLLGITGGIGLALIFGVSGFYEIKPENGGVLIFFGIILKSVAGPGPHWRPWPFVKFVQTRVVEFGLRSKGESNILSKDTMPIIIDLTVRVIITDLINYYINIFTTEEKDADTIKELIATYKRNYVINFPAVELPAHRREIACWFIGNTKKMEKAIERWNKESPSTFANFPNGFVKQYNLPDALYDWGIWFPKTFVHSVLPPGDVLKEKSQIQSELIETDGLIDRTKLLAKKLGIEFTEAYRIVERQQRKRTTIELDSPGGAGEILKAATIVAAGSGLADKSGNKD